LDNHLSDKGLLCPRCESQSYRILFQGSDHLYQTTQKKFSVIECSTCTLIRLLPKPTPDEYVSYYPKHYWWKPKKTLFGLLTELYRRVAIWDHVRFITGSSVPSGLTLDIGAGGGMLSQAMHRNGRPSISLDFSPTATQIAACEGLPTVRAYAPDMPFIAQSFSAVVMLHVLEHVGNPVDCLSAVRQLLRPGGKLFIQVTNASSWQFLLFGRHWSALDIPRHLIHFRADDLEDLLSACGFHVVRRKFFSLRDNPASVATSLLPSWEPAVRATRETHESSVGTALKNFLYFALVALSFPFAILEAIAMAGSTVLLEAVLHEDK